MVNGRGILRNELNRILGEATVEERAEIRYEWRLVDVVQTNDDEENKGVTANFEVGMEKKREVEEGMLLVGGNGLRSTVR